MSYSQEWTKAKPNFVQFLKEYKQCGATLSVKNILEYLLSNKGWKCVFCPT